MDFGKVVSELSAMGYKRAAARAKIAHDVVLAAMRFFKMVVEVQ